MALLYQAELRPSKMELLDGWAPSQPWFRGEPGVKLVSVAAFRFDDPEGEVGVETHLVRAGDGPIMQMPVTYRGAPLVGAEESLIGTMEHSVLGKRWVYDGAGDPVYLLTVASVALAGAGQAELVVEVDGELVKQEPNAMVTGGIPPRWSPAMRPAVPCPEPGMVSLNLSCWSRWGRDGHGRALLSPAR